MASTSLTKKPASFMREHTQQVRDHSAAVARITERYFATLERAKAQYFDDIRRVTDAAFAVTEPVAEPVAIANGPPAP